MPKQYRLKSRQDFQNVYKRGRRWKGKCLMVRCLSQSPIIKVFSEGTIEKPKSSLKLPSVTKFGISVSQKVSKKAVIRNRLKRQIRAALRALLTRINPGLLVVISLSPAAIECNYHELFQELEHLLVEAGAIQPLA